jgi:ketosteroid isomerase-like protein
MADNLTTVASIYEAFGRGDVPAILAALSEDVQWEEWADNHAQKFGVPWLQHRRGKAGALDFFALAGQFTMHEFQVLSLLAGGNQVVAEVLIDATVPTGARYRDEELHLWTFDASGQVIRLRHYVDTAKHIAAAEPTRNDSSRATRH